MGLAEKNWPLLRPIAIVGIFTLVFHRFWGHSIVYSDSFRYFAPAKFLVAEALKKGTIYAWDPYLFLGIPFVAEAHAGWFYPLNVIYFLFSFEPAHRLFLLIHYPMAAIFMDMFLRGRGIDGKSSLFGALVFSLSGYLTSQHAYLNTLIASAWAPFAFYCVDRALRGSKAWALGAGAALAMQIFAGEPEVAAVTSALIALMCLGVSFSGKRRRYALLSLFFTALSSLFLSAVQWMPTLELMRRSTRHGGMSLYECSLFSFHPARIVELVWPLPFGTLWPEAYYWGKFALDGIVAPNPWAITNYVSLPVLLLAIFGVWRSGRSWKVWAGAGMVFFLVLSLGRYAPLFALFHRFFPLFNWFRYPERFMGWFTGFTAVAAALGLEEMQRRLADLPHAAARTSLTYLIIVVVGAVGAVFFWPIVVHGVTSLESGSVEYRMVLSNLFDGGKQWFTINLIIGLVGFLAAKRLLSVNKGIALAFLALLLDLSMTNVSMMPSGPPDIFKFKSLAGEIISPEGRPLLGVFRIHKTITKMFSDRMFSKFSLVERMAIWRKSTLGDNLQAMEGFEDLNGYYPLELTGWGVMLRSILNSGMLKLYNVRYLISNYIPQSSTESIVSQIIYNDRDMNMSITHYSDAWPRAYWEPFALAVSSEKDALAILSKTDMRKYVILETDEKLPTADGGNRAMVPAKIARYEPDRVEIESDVDAAGWLVLSDRDYPGWTAKVDGRPAEIYKANVMVRAVKLPAGRHTTVFRYRPLSLYVGGVISLLSWILAISWWAKAILSRKIASS